MEIDADIPYEDIRGDRPASRSCRIASGKSVTPTTDCEGDDLLPGAVA
ncbi:MAG: hypothetical protein VZQ80_11760 [Lachnospiraceae bacterium]|nr:hypothetical protein [Bacillota bacterium]MEE3482628.1 hypothetical protein [Lachnospiraceae bacterium]